MFAYRLKESVVRQTATTDFFIFDFKTRHRIPPKKASVPKCPHAIPTEFVFGSSYNLQTRFCTLFTKIKYAVYFRAGVCYNKK